MVVRRDRGVWWGRVVLGGITMYGSITFDSLVLAPGILVHCDRTAVAEIVSTKHFGQE